MEVMSKNCWDILKEEAPNKMKKIVFIAVFLMGFIGFSQSNPVKIAIDTTQIKIGEKIIFQISVDGIQEVVFPQAAKFGKS